MNYDNWKTTNAELEANEEIYDLVYNMSLEDIMSTIQENANLFDDEIDALYEAVASRMIDGDL